MDIGNTGEKLMSQLKQLTPAEIGRVQLLLRYSARIVEYVELVLKVSDEDFAILVRTLNFVMEEMDSPLTKPTELQQEATAFLIHQVLNDRK